MEVIRAEVLGDLALPHFGTGKKIRATAFKKKKFSTLKQKFGLNLEHKSPEHQADRLGRHFIG